MFLWSQNVVTEIFTIVMAYRIYISGTRIIYDRKFLMSCRKSPLAKSPPANLPSIPGVTTPDQPALADIKENGTPPGTTHKPG